MRPSPPAHEAGVRVVPFTVCHVTAWAGERLPRPLPQPGELALRSGELESQESSYTSTPQHWKCPCGRTDPEGVKASEPTPPHARHCKGWTCQRMLESSPWWLESSSWWWRLGRARGLTNPETTQAQTRVVCRPTPPSTPVWSAGARVKMGDAVL